MKSNTYKKLEIVTYIIMALAVVVAYLGVFILGNQFLDVFFSGRP